MMHVIITGPPSAVYNLTYSMNGTTINLEWLPPMSSGNRSDIFYR